MQLGVQPPIFHSSISVQPTILWWLRQAGWCQTICGQTKSQSVN